MPQGDFVLDERLPDDACSAITQKVQDSNSNLYYVLIHSKRVDASGDLDKCVDDTSVAGCFACTFKCK